MAPQQRPDRAFILDVDGCLSREGIPIPGSKSALHQLHNNSIPFVVCTNGGGQLESTRAARLSKTFDIPISPNQVILSHTPLRTELVPRFKDDRVLIVGENCAPVARDYGFIKAEGVREYCARHPSLFPRRREADAAAVDDSNDPVKAILVFEDPEDLGEALQLMVDVLLTNGNPSGPRVLLDPDAKQEVECWFTNPDLVYSGLATHPRLTQGSFRLCLETLFQSATSASPDSYNSQTMTSPGRMLQATTMGKPTQLTGKTAISKLLQQCESNTKEQDLEIWTVGDNPFSDGELILFVLIIVTNLISNVSLTVALANNMGWSSALVRTGIWNGDESILEGNAVPTKIVDCMADLIQQLNIR